MRISLEQAEACLAADSPRGYVQQLQAASEALARARAQDGKGGGNDELLAQFRRELDAEPTRE